MGVRQRFLVLSLVDIGIITVAVVLAYLLRFDFEIEPRFFALIPYVVLMYAGITMFLLHRQKLYKRVWQYASIGEMVAIIKATTLASVLFFLVHSVLQLQFPQFVVPRSIYILVWVLSLLGIGGSRFLWRVFRDSYLKIQPHQKRTLIVGAGDAGAMVAKELKHAPYSSFYPVAYVDDDPKKRHLEVMGLPILGSTEEIPEIVVRHRIQQIVIAMPSAPRSRLSEVIEICKPTQTELKILPRVSDLIDGRVSLKMIRDVQVEDLLGREPVQVNLQEIAGYVRDQVILVTGAGGSIGSELCRQLAPFSPQKLLLLGHGENSVYDIELELRQAFPELPLQTLIADIKDQSRLEQVFAQYRPRVVFHAAAHKHVPLMEQNPGEAVKNNVLGTRNVALYAHRYGAQRFVMISTDKAVNPTSVMGATKRVAEMFVQALDRVSETRFVAVRFGNVLGSRGSVIPVFKRQIELGGPVTVTDPEMVRYFMTIPEAVQLVIQAGALAKGGEVFILDMGQPVKIVDLARDLIRLSGLKPDEDIRIIYTGIRPGEKLYEEILTAEEGTTATRHQRIFVGRPGEMSIEELDFFLRKLERLITDMEKKVDDATLAEEVKRMLKQLVPTYQGDAEVNEASEGERRAVLENVGVGRRGETT